MKISSYANKISFFSALRHINSPNYLQENLRDMWVLLSTFSSLKFEITIILEWGGGSDLTMMEEKFDFIFNTLTSVMFQHQDYGCSVSSEINLWRSTNHSWRVGRSCREVQDPQGTWVTVRMLSPIGRWIMFCLSLSYLN